MPNSSSEPEAIVFDCDGVLVDSEVIAVRIESMMLTAAGFPMTFEEVASTFVGLSEASVMRLVEERFGRPVPPELNDQIHAHTLAAFNGELEAVAGIDALLAATVVPRCVASSSTLDRIILSLKLTKLDQHFATEHIYSAQMVERGKPEPDLFLHAAQGLGVDPAACVVVEDSPHGVVAGVAAGMDVIGFTAGLHSTPDLADRLRTAGARRIAETAGALGDMLAGS